MRHKLIAVALLMAAALPVWSAGKTTTDPNTATKIETPAPEPLWKTDKRLDHKIEYDAGNARLHDVIADLAKASGVTIYCGKASNDWRVRDIPVTVAARGIALRDLLQYIVYTTHAKLLAKKTEEGVITYRVIADPKAQKAIDDDAQARDDYQKAYAASSLRLASLFKDIPFSELKPPKGSEDQWTDTYASMLALSKLLEAMDPDLKQVISAGQPITLTPRTAPADLREALLSGLRAADNHWLNSAIAANAGDPRAGEGSSRPSNAIAASDEDLEDSQVTFTCTGSNHDIAASFYATVKEAGGIAHGYGASSGQLALFVRQHDNGKTNAVKDPAWYEPRKIEPPNTDSKPLDWNNPAIPRLVTLERPKGDKPLSGSDAAIAISKTTGLSFINEDFEGHRRTDDLRDSLCQEMPFPSALCTAMDCDYMFDSKTKSIIGCNHYWAIHHKNLVPESILQNLVAKANGDGVDVDDLAVLADYPATAVRDWTGTGQPSLCGLSRYIESFILPANQPFWSFYNSLLPSDKLQVKSKDGLAIAQRNIAPILECLANQAQARAGTISGADKSIQEQLLSPKVSLTLVMRLETSQYQAGFLWDSPMAMEQNWLGSGNRRDCVLVIEGTDGPRKIRLQIGTDPDLPYFSPERKKALTESLNKQNKTTAAEQPGNG